MDDTISNFFKLMVDPNTDALTSTWHHYYRDNSIVTFIPIHWCLSLWYVLVGVVCLCFNIFCYNSPIFTTLPHIILHFLFAPRLQIHLLMCEANVLAKIVHQLEWTNVFISLCLCHFFFFGGRVSVIAIMRVGLLTAPRDLHVIIGIRASIH